MRNPLEEFHCVFAVFSRSSPSASGHVGHDLGSTSAIYTTSSPGSRSPDVGAQSDRRHIQHARFGVAVAVVQVVPKEKPMPAKNEPARVLVTGASGNVGGEVATALDDTHSEVIAVRASRNRKTVEQWGRPQKTRAGSSTGRPNAQTSATTSPTAHTRTPSPMPWPGWVRGGGTCARPARRTCPAPGG